MRPFPSIATQISIHTGPLGSGSSGILPNSLWPAQPCKLTTVYFNNDNNFFVKLLKKEITLHCSIETWIHRRRFYCVPLLAIS